ncbi:transcriptional regulator [Nocardiopsis sp. CNT-189]|uniref:methanogen output domain 1-containing protein n=1 Tax=Nocardiopsis oceanisediminis TaxID=2816862 RepID=UPI003B2BB143
MPVDTEAFMRRLLVELAASLEETIGPEEAAGHIGLAAQRMGDELGPHRPRGPLGPERIAAALIDLYRGIDGDLRLVSCDGERIVLANLACPFGAGVRGREALCTMTSGLAGDLAARHTGYARVDLAETIARGRPRCLIEISLHPGPDDGPGEEYYGPGADGPC